MKLRFAMAFLSLILLQEGCASLAAELLLRTLFLPLDLAFKDNLPQATLPSSASEEAKPCPATLPRPAPTLHAGVLKKQENQPMSRA